MGGLYLKRKTKRRQRKPNENKNERVAMIEAKERAPMRESAAGRGGLFCQPELGSWYVRHSREDRTIVVTVVVTFHYNVGGGLYLFCSRSSTEQNEIGWKKTADPPAPLPIPRPPQKLCRYQCRVRGEPLKSKAYILNLAGSTLDECPTASDQQFHPVVSLEIFSGLKDTSRSLF